MDALRAREKFSITLRKKKKSEILKLRRQSPEQQITLD